MPHRFRLTLTRVLRVLGALSVAVLLPAQPGPAPRAHAAGNIAGQVFQDFNANGTRDTAATIPNDGAGSVGVAIDQGVGGVTVTAYDAGGAVVGTATTAANGTYALAASGTGPYRVEFTNLPAGYRPGPHGPNNGTTVLFVPDGNSAGVDLGINYPADYCQNNPELVTPCYVNGDQLAGPNRTQSVMESFPYSAGSNGATIPPYDNPASHSLVITATQVGTTWGLAYARSSQRLFAGAYMKKHAGFGAGGPGAVYVIDRPSASVVATYTVPGATTNAHNPANYQTDNGNTAWNAVGKTSLGGMAMSEDEARLYAMNLEDRSLYALNPATGAVITSQGVPLNPPLGAGTCPANDVRPFAVEMYHSVLYVGMICSAETSQSAADLQAYVYTVNPITLAFSAAPVFQTALNYPRGLANDGATGQSAAWNPWVSSFQALPPTIGNPNWDFPVYPQPMFTGLAFSNGDMVIGLRDRFGDQTGNQAPDNPASPLSLYHGVTGGDTLLACANGGGGWTLESNGRCNGVGTAPQGTNQGPGGGEFYFADDYSNPPNSGNFHDEVSMGGMVHVPGFPDVVTTMFDPVPIFDPDTIFDTGFRWLNSNGGLTKAYRLRNGSVGDPVTFGKANGLGDLLALCDAAPIEIGNRVWLDTDKDGVQDPGETPLAGVTVRLYAPDGVTVLATAITNANGEYYFSNASGTTTGNAIYGIAGLQPNTNGYTVRLDNPADYTGGGPLAGLSPTLVNSDGSANGDSRDSDGLLVNGFPQTTVNTGGPGANDHTFDFGFATNPTAVSLLYFRIDSVFGSQVKLAWATAAEIDNFGFNLYRAPTADFAQATLIHFEPSALQAGTGSGASYSFTDTTPAKGVWWYWLADVSREGVETVRPPVTTGFGATGQPFQLYVPMVKH